MVRTPNIQCYMYAYSMKSLNELQNALPLDFELLRIKVFHFIESKNKQNKNKNVVFFFFLGGGGGGGGSLF